MEIIIKPVLTEKMTIQGEKLNRYGFIVDVMPLELIPGLKKKDLYGSVYHFIREQCGLKISSFHRTIRAVAATEEEANRLDTKPGSPLLELTQIGFLDSGAAFEYSISRNVGDRFELHNVTLA